MTTLTDRTLPAGAELVDPVDTSRGAWPRYNPRPTEYLPASHASTPALLLSRLHPSTRRVFTTGPAWGAGYGEATAVGGARAWALDTLPPGWTVDPAGHYLDTADAPVARFAHEGGQRVEIHRAAVWGAADSDTPATVEAAHTVLRGRLVDAFGAGWLSTPATTGRDLWRRTIPHDGPGYPVLSAELRELIASTSGQGRAELIVPDDRPELPGLAILDARFAYAALTWGMPCAGAGVRWWTAATLGKLAANDTAAVLRLRGRFRARVVVPAKWDHVGLLPCPDGTRWRYPSRPGESFTTWAEAAELDLARAAGWRLELLEGVTFGEGKPLDVWTRRLVTLNRQLGASVDPVDRLAARMVRLIVLQAIGAFAGRAHPVTRTAPLDRPDAVPPGVGPSVVGDSLVWTENRPPAGWSLPLLHPEWAAAIWGRTRARLLSAPTGVAGVRAGALHVDPSHVVAFRTDALYLTVAPAWPDDGKVGRYRLKGTLGGPLPAPTTVQELLRLRNRATD